jgi:hypothetical protein
MTHKINKSKVKRLSKALCPKASTWLYLNIGMTLWMLVLSSSGDQLSYRLFCIVKFEILAAVITKSTVFWNVMPCSLVDVYRRFEGTYCLQIQGRTSNQAN